MHQLPTDAAAPRTTLDLDDAARCRAIEAVLDAVTASEAALAVVDAGGRVTWANTGMRHLLGEAEAVDVHEATSQGWRALAVAIDAAGQAGRPWEDELALARGGDEAVVHVTLTPRMAAAWSPCSRT